MFLGCIAETTTTTKTTETTTTIKTTETSKTTETTKNTETTTTTKTTETTETRQMSTRLCVRLHFEMHITRRTVTDCDLLFIFGFIAKGFIKVCQPKTSPRS